MSVGKPKKTAVGAAPAAAQTFQACLLADATASACFNVQNSLSAQHALLTPVAGVALVDFFLHQFLDYNAVCAKASAGAENEDATPFAVTDLFVLTRSKQLKKHVDLWSRRNLLGALSVKVELLDEGGEDEVLTKRELFFGFTAPALKALNASNLINKDFLLVEPNFLLQEPKGLVGLFQTHLAARRSNKEACVTQGYFPLSGGFGKNGATVPAQRKHCLLVENSTEELNEVLFLAPEAEGTKPAGLGQYELFKREGGFRVEYKRGHVHVGICVCAPSFLEKFADDDFADAVGQFF